MIVIIDYDMGNPGAIRNMLRKVGSEAIISRALTDIERADCLILPGVGAFDAGMRNMDERGITEVLRRRVVDEHIPILGICLGMQLLTRASEEGSRKGLNLLAGYTKRFAFDVSRSGLKIPHMGWNTLNVKGSPPLFRGLCTENRFYFVHSYHVVCDRARDVLATTFYGYDFASAVQHGRVFGFQFHPEKSHRFGMALLRNFVARIHA